MNFPMKLSSLHLQWVQYQHALAVVVCILITIACCYRIFRKNKKTNRLIENYEKGKIYLFQFPSTKTIVNISPFALKLETFLRLHKLPYETISCLNVWSVKGQIPFIELDGIQYAESNLIIQMLKQHFQMQIQENLTSSEEAIARGFEMMMDNQTVYSIFYYRYVVEVKQFIQTWHFVGKFFQWFLILRFPKGFRKRYRMHGIGRNSLEEIIEIGQRDFQALSDYLNEKKFLFGDQMTTIDCYLFSHLAQIVDIPQVNYPHRQYIQKHCLNLLEYYKRVKLVLWPDWNDVCQMKGIPQKF